MIERDFHEWQSMDVVNEIHNIVGQVRASGTKEDVKFITGNGVLKQLVINVLKFDYDVSAREEIGNSGAVIAIIE